MQREIDHRKKGNVHKPVEQQLKLKPEYHKQSANPPQTNDEIQHKQKTLITLQLDHVFHETGDKSTEGKQQNSEVMKRGEIPVKKSRKAAKEEVNTILRRETWNFFSIYERHIIEVD
ncbi:hypothetical protein QQF64_035018 [Cirrhinus molitorella]|uniref:Uncharacterized protein n=1 Tax=Cirrhinus molitorella TaxID=172907 RepID=A0ABR3NFE2_9TELE